MLWDAAMCKRSVTGCGCCLDASTPAPTPEPIALCSTATDDETDKCDGQSGICLVDEDDCASHGGTWDLMK